VRTLHFGSEWIQGAMRIARPWNLELEYTREMMASLLLRDAPGKVLLIGLGAASLTKFLYRHYPLAHLTVVESGRCSRRGARFSSCRRDRSSSIW
jgi:spermidine synthase